MPHTQMRVHSIYVVIYDISTQQTLVLYEFHCNSFKANLGILQNKATQIHHQILKYLKNLTENTELNFKSLSNSFFKIEDKEGKKEEKKCEK